jgi:mono/diheme cytochrome c family protein
MTSVTYRPLLLAALLLAAPIALAAPAGDAKKGQAAFEAQCAECHEAGDLKGAAGKAFADKTAAIVAGTAKHKPKLKISAAEAADVTAWLATLK